MHVINEICTLQSVIISCDRSGFDFIIYAILFANTKRNSCLANSGVNTMLIKAI